MARTHGRVMAAIWNDGDFITMRATAQRMFMFLLSQPDLSHAGLLPMRVNRWAKKADDLSAKTVRAELDYLAERDFVVVDEDTEEVLIRTMVRNDGVYKQPKVMLRLREDAKQIESPLLRYAFKGELERLPLHELTTARQAVEDIVADIRGDFAQDGYPTEGVSDTPGRSSPVRETDELGNAAGQNPSERVSDTHPDTPHVRAGALPQPPTPSPHPPATDQSASRSPATAVASKPDPMARFEEFWDTYGKKLDRKSAETRWRAALKKPNVTPDLLIDAAAAYVLFERTHNEGGRFICHPSTWLNGERWRDERVVRAPQQTNVQRHLDLVRELEQQGGALPQIGDGR